MTATGLWSRQRSGIGRKLFFTTALACFAGMLMAASCQEAKDGAPEQSAKAKDGKKAMPEEKPSAKKSFEDVFEPQVAGSFYPADTEKLRGMIADYIEKASVNPEKTKGDLLGIMVPHAGYPYSGPVAAHAFALLKGRHYRRVVVLGPAHRRAYAEPALLDADAYRTPLGDIAIDKKGVARLQASGAARVDNAKFTREHALEVELPFLQVALGEFELVALMISRTDPEKMRDLASALRKIFPGPDTLFVASTDMSHDYPYDVAKALDKNALRYIAALDPDGLFEAYRAFKLAGRDIEVGDEGRPEPDCAQLCGMGPVLVMLHLAKSFEKPQAAILDVRNSGDIVGDKSSRIVGYSAVAVLLGEPRTEPAEKEEEKTGTSGDYLDEDERRALLRIARQSLEAYFETGEKKDFEPQSEKLKEPGAAFVTLKKKGQLRGCIGYMEPIEPLWEMIRNRALDAALHDSRFRPVKKEELSDIHIEISVLTPRVAVEDPLKEIKIGRDGVWLEVGRNRGVFLPQVPVEQGWETVELYLDHLCRKAHIFERGCWKSPHARIMRFEALVFGEEKDTH